MKSRESTRKKTLDLLLRGLVVCKECGKKMSTTVDSRGNHTRYLRCSSYASAPKLHICTPHIMNYNKLENATFDKKIVDYEKIMAEFLNKDNITSYMRTSLIEKIEVDNDKNVTIYYKFSPLNNVLS